MSTRWSRREFVQWMGYSSLASAALGSPLLAAEGKPSTASFAYVAAKDGAEEGIHGYAVRRGWEKLQVVESSRPVALTLAPSRRFLYAVNEVDSHKGLPVGTIEAFAIGQDGRLTLLNRRELALSATMPRHAAVTPDGRNLVVAVSGGGAYNVLPIGEDGSLGRVSSMLKEIGVERESGSSQAQPRMVAFDTAGRVVSVDGGADRLNVLSVGDEGIRAHARAGLSAGCRASQVAMHPAGERLYVMQGEAISCHPYDATAGRVSEPTQHLSIAGAMEGPGTMAVPPSGRFLYACQRGGGVAAWGMGSRGDGISRPLGLQVAAMGELHAIEIAPDGRSVMGVSRNKGLIQRAELDPGTGRLSAGDVVAQVNSPSSLVVLYS
ncbi:lactonase family protein [Edaphobacter modestus]|uniref:6-phosphogluconolactonase (Cycloisomerase 2 family) n=1 Tax=Edaphobacter modestus TaxID=388466 RepID=A0A4Q7YQJ4_9BACT|nr:beta-propeller fold lactonase family protein [Edaphobacter modestus]RZU39025.1 6-phosphogluconolactonase (cycloisomerase 2 family) [Edaphobacter modestus]